MLRFEHIDAASTSEAVSLLDKYGEQAKVIAGGTDLLVNIRQRAVSPRYIINLKSIPNLNYVKDYEEGLEIGSLTPLRVIENSSMVKLKHPTLATAAHSIGSVQIRNQGTVGGNVCQDRKCWYYNQSHISLFQRQSLKPCWARKGSVCHTVGKDNPYQAIMGGKQCWAASPSDMAPAFIALDATAEIIGPNGQRSVPFKDFFTGPGETVLGPSEILTAIRVPRAPSGTRGAYFKYSRRPIESSMVAVAAQARMKNAVCHDIRLALGAASPVPIRATRVEELLRGKKLEDQLIEEAAEIALQGARSWGPATEFKIVKAKSLLKDMLRLISKPNSEDDV